MFRDTSLSSDRSVLLSAVELDVLGPGLFLCIILKIKIILHINKQTWLLQQNSLRFR